MSQETVLAQEIAKKPRDIFLFKKGHTEEYSQDPKSYEELLDNTRHLWLSVGTMPTDQFIPLAEAALIPDARTFKTLLLGESTPDTIIPQWVSEGNFPNIAAYAELGEKPLGEISQQIADALVISIGKALGLRADTTNLASIRERIKAGSTSFAIFSDMKCSSSLDDSLENFQVRRGLKKKGKK